MKNIKGLPSGRQGFTIVEILLYMGILSLFLLVLTQLFTSSLNSQLESQSVSNVEQDARFIILRLTHDIMLSSAITTPNAPGAQSATLVMTVNNATYTYSLNGSNLQLNDSTNSTQLNSYESTISSLNFLRLGSATGKDSITINFTITDKTIQTSGQTSKSYTTTVTTR